MAHEGGLKQSGLPLATTINTITNRLWLKLHKGFSENNIPKSFDVITNAQIVLSGQLNNSVSDEYAELKEKMDQGTITEEAANDLLVKYKEKLKPPEEIIDDNIDDILKTLNKKTLGDVIKTNIELADKASTEQEKNSTLLGQNKRLEEENKQYKKDIKEKDAIIDIYKAKEHTLEIEKIKKQKQIANCLYFVCVVLIIFAVAVGLYYRYVSLPILLSGVVTVIAILNYFKITPSTIKNWVKNVNKS